jgi:hypothetical protein
MDRAFQQQDRVPRQRERQSRGNAHQARTGKAVEHKFPTRGDELSAGERLCGLPCRRDQRTNQRIVVG